MRRFTESEDALIVQRMTEGVPRSRIADELGRAWSALTYHVRNHLMRQFPDLPIKHYKRESQYDDLILQRRQEGASKTTIAREIGRSSNYIAARLPPTSKRRRAPYTAEELSKAQSLIVEGMELTKVAGLLNGSPRGLKRALKSTAAGTEIISPDLRKARSWSEEELKSLVELAQQGMDYATIALRLGRSLQAVESQLSVIRRSNGESKIHTGVTATESMTIRELRDDWRMSFRAIASQLGRDQGTIQRHYKKLQNDT